MKPRLSLQRTFILFPILIFISFSLYAYHLLTKKHNETDITLPKIQGIMLKNPEKLINVNLTNQAGQLVDSEYFKGKWHVIAYGYTHCPDICPTTLFTLTKLDALVNDSNNNPETKFVFYTVDPQRDTQDKLAQYIQYFSNDFVAVRAQNPLAAHNFQQSLGINVEISYANSKNSALQGINIKKATTTERNNNFYYVNHGLTILLINPEAELQAVFSPEMTELGIKDFTSEALYRDYLKVTSYYQMQRLL